MAYLGSMQTPPITINVPTGDSLGVTDHNRPYMLGGPGQMDATAQQLLTQLQEPLLVCLVQAGAISLTLPVTY